MTPQTIPHRTRSLISSFLPVLLALVGVVALPAATVAAAGTGRTIGSAPVKVYAQPSTTSTVLGSIPVNTTITLDCGVSNGTSVSGPYGATRYWHNIRFNNRAAWVPDAFTYTGRSGLAAGEPGCATGRIDTGGAAIPVWSTPTSGVKVGTIPNGTVVTLFCGMSGSSFSGKWGSSTLWHMVGLAAGWGYIPDSSTYTGSSSMPSGEYRCPSAPTSPTAPATTTITLSGRVTCETFGAVQGVWLQSSAGGSKWASWTAASGGAATYTAVFTINGSTTNVTLSVGCGGSPASWTATALTPPLQMSSTRQMDASCAPLTGGSTVSCTWRSALPRLSLPFATGETWTASGTHDWNGGGVAGAVTTSTHRSSIDFSGGSGVVRAAGDGTVRITACGLVMIDHGQNVWTSYYHINKNANIADGMTITRGTALGTIGTRTDCGGSAAGAHLHFTVWNMPSGTRPAAVDNNNGAQLNGRCIGGWQVIDDSRNYWSSYKRLTDGSVQASLANFASIKNDGVAC